MLYDRSTPFIDISQSTRRALLSVAYVVVDAVLLENDGVGIKMSFVFVGAENSLNAIRQSLFPFRFKCRQP
jgi:hypothetical protein